MGFSVGLALSGGGILGIMHIGVLSVLEEAGILPDVVTGASAGAVVGVLHACGYSAGEIMQIFDGLTLSALLDPFTRGSETKDADVLFSVMPRGLVKGDLIERWFSQLVRGATFESIDKSVAVVAADLAAARQIVFGKTPSAPTRLKIMSNVPVASALRASVSLPGVFAPFLLGETLLVDGGVVNNLPTDVARELGANYVIGVDIGRPRSPVTGIRTFVDVILEAFSVMGQTVDRCHAQNERNFRGFIIHPTVTRKYGWNRGAMAELYGIGRRAALEALPAIKKDLRLAP